MGSGNLAGVAGLGYLFLYRPSFLHEAVRAVGRYQGGYVARWLTSVEFTIGRNRCIVSDREQYYCLDNCKAQKRREPVTQSTAFHDDMEELRDTAGDLVDFLNVQYPKRNQDPLRDLAEQLRQAADGCSAPTDVAAVSEARKDLWSFTLTEDFVGYDESMRHLARNLCSLAQQILQRHRIFSTTAARD